MCLGAITLDCVHGKRVPLQCDMCCCCVLRTCHSPRVPPAIVHSIMDTGVRPSLGRLRNWVPTLSNHPENSRIWVGLKKCTESLQLLKKHVPVDRAYDYLLVLVQL